MGIAPKIQELPSVFVLEDFTLVPRSGYLSGLSWLVIGIGWDLCRVTQGTPFTPGALQTRATCAVPARRRRSGSGKPSAPCARRSAGTSSASASRAPTTRWPGRLPGPQSHSRPVVWDSCTRGSDVVSWEGGGVDGAPRVFHCFAGIWSSQGSGFTRPGESRAGCAEVEVLLEFSL